MSKPNFNKWAKEFAATFAVNLPNKLWTVYVATLTTMLEDAYKSGAKHEQQTQTTNNMDTYEQP